MGEVGRQPSGPGLGATLAQRGLIPPQDVRRLYAEAQQAMAASGSDRMPGRASSGSGRLPPMPPPGSGSGSGSGSGQHGGGTGRTQRPLPSDQDLKATFRRAALEDETLARLVVGRGLVAPDALASVRRATQDAHRSGRSPLLGQELVRARMISPKALPQLQAEVKAALHDCPGCRMPLFAERAPTGRQVPCPECRSPVPVPPAGVGAAGSGAHVAPSGRGWSSNVGHPAAGSSAPQGTPIPALQSGGRTAPFATASGSGSLQRGSASGNFGRGSASGSGTRSGSRAIRRPMGPPPCGETFGPYEIIRELGRGTSGTVYLGCDRRNGAEVAVKILADELSARDQRRAKLRKQLDLVRTLDHPSVVRVLDDGEREGRPYYVMELIQGRPLTELLRGDMDLEFAMEIFEKVAQGVHHAHERGCLHLDLKPQNVLITRDGEPRVSDFGIARAVERQPVLSKPGVVSGIPYYMAPELVRGRGRDYGARTDVFSLGVMMYEMLTGRLPFVGRSNAELRRRLVQDDPEPPRKVRPSLTPEVEAVSTRCLEKDPTDRYANCADLAADIGRLLKGEPVAIPVKSRVRVKLRRLRRRLGTTTILVGGAGILVAIALIVAVVLYGVHRSGYKQRLLETWTTALGGVEQAIDDAGAARVEARAALAGAEPGTALATLRQALSELDKAAEGPERIGGPPEDAYGDEQALEQARRDYEMLQESLARSQTRTRLAHAVAVLAIGDADDIDRAKQEVGQIVADSPDDGEAKACQVLYDIVTGEHEAALEEIDAIVRVSPTSARERLLWARAAAWVDDWTTVTPLVAPLTHERGDLETTPEQRLEALVFSALASWALGERRRALDDLNEAITLRDDAAEPRIVRAQVLAEEPRDEAAVFADLAAARAAAPHRAAEIQAIQSHIERAWGFPEEAVEAADAALAEDPQSFPAFLARAAAREATLDLRGARDDAESVVQEAPRRLGRLRAEAGALVARLDWADGRRAPAIEEVEKARRSWPNVSTALLLGGFLRVAADRPEEAMLTEAFEAFGRVRKSRPNLARAHLGLAVVYKLRREKDLTKAGKRARRAADLDPLDAYAFVVQALISDEKKEPDEARKMRADVADLFDDPRSEAGRLVMIGLAQSRRAAALERDAWVGGGSELTTRAEDARRRAELAFSAGIVLDPTNVLGLIGRAEIDLAKGQRPETARKRLDAALAVGVPHLRAHVLRCLVALPGDLPRAIEELDAARTLAPDEPIVAALEAITAYSGRRTDPKKLAVALAAAEKALTASAARPDALLPSPSPLSAPELRTLRARIFRELGKNAEARAADAEGDAAKTAAANARRAVDRARGQIGKALPAEALATVEEVLATSPGDASAHAVAARALAALDRPIEALAAAARAAMLDPAHHRLFEERSADTLAPAGKAALRAVEDAIADGRISDDDPRVPDVLRSMAAAADLRGKAKPRAEAATKTGLDAADRALALDRTATPALFARARLLTLVGDLSAAERDARRVTILADESPMTWRLLAEIALAFEPARIESAIRFLRRGSRSGLGAASVVDDPAFQPISDDPRFSALFGR